MSITSLGIQSVRKGATAEQPEELDAVTGWPKGILDGLGWVGDRMDDLDKAVGVPGTDLDVYHARQSIIKPLSEQHVALGILGEIFIPDSIDIASYGAAYIPNRFRRLGKAGIKAWAAITRSRRPAKAVRLDKLEAARLGLNRPFQHTGDFSKDRDDIIKKIADTWEDGRDLGWKRTDEFNKQLGDYSSTDELAEELVKLHRGAAIQTPGGTILGDTVKSDITGRISGNPSFTKFGDKTPVVRYTPKDFDLADAESIAKWKRSFNTQKKVFKTENHHIAELAEFKKAVKGLPTAERQLALDWMVQKGIFLGNNPFNKAVLAERVHKGVSSWVTRNMAQYLKDFEKTRRVKIKDLPLDERWEVFEQLAALARESEKVMFSFVQAHRASYGLAEFTTETIARVFGDLEIPDAKWFDPNLPKIMKESGMDADDLIDARPKIDKWHASGGPFKTRKVDQFNPRNPDFKGN